MNQQERNGHNTTGCLLFLVFFWGAFWMDTCGEQFSCNRSGARCGQCGQWIPR